MFFILLYRNAIALLCQIKYKRIGAWR